MAGLDGTAGMTEMKWLVLLNRMGAMEGSPALFQHYKSKVKGLADPSIHTSV